jgi:hypothetical protein
MLLKLKKPELSGVEVVWKYDCSYFLKYFSLENASK